MPDLDTDMHLRMLRDFRRKKPPLFMAEWRGYAARGELERAIDAGQLPFETGPKGARLVEARTWSGFTDARAATTTACIGRPGSRPAA